MIMDASIGTNDEICQLTVECRESDDRRDETALLAAITRAEVESRTLIAGTGIVRPPKIDYAG